LLGGGGALSAIAIPQQTVLSGYTTIDLADGSQVRGQLLHDYDEASWWHPNPVQSYALFQPRGFRSGINDRSLRFLSTPEVVAVHPPTGIAVEPYLPFLRRHGIALAELPLHGISQVLTGNESYHLQEDGYGDFAWDLTRTDALGARFRGSGASNQDYLVWDQPVYLPTAGTVVEVSRDNPDNAPGFFPPDAPNNLIGVRLQGGYFLYLLHFRQGTIPANIQPGVSLAQGSYLGRVGNAGVTLEPHLHLSMLWWDATGVPPRFWSVPSEFLEIHTRAAGETNSTFHDHLAPATGTYLSSAAF